MLPKIDPTSTSAWKALHHHYDEVSRTSLRELFQEDPERLSKLSQEWDGIYVDFSKHRVDDRAMSLLRKVAEQCSVEEGIRQMFAGEAINETEGRAVLHTALRNRSNRPVMVNGQDVMPEINVVLEQMRLFSERVRSGEWKGYSGEAITTVVNIGIGGSDLGPAMAVQALAPFQGKLKLHFVSNVDEADILSILTQVDPATTLFIIASKTFTTQETMTNAHTARSWFMNKVGDASAIAKHFVALSTNTEKVTEFGIAEENIFRFWDWVGGRYSLWGAIGLPIMLAVGPAQYFSMLEGAHAVDEHLKVEGINSIPATMALLGIWYNNFFKVATHAVLPYSQYLLRFPAYLQQADMESNGKSMDRSGRPVHYQTGPVVWGEPGTNGQHAFYQLIHQGTKLIPCDFITYAQPVHGQGDHHAKLLANCFAQSQALMDGKSISEVEASLKAEGLSEEEVERLLPFKLFEGNNPSTTLLFDAWSPYALGQLIALYEHKIFIQGLIWNIYSFDQWGVELGKALAKPILENLSHSQSSVAGFDTSTAALIARTTSLS